MAMLEAFVYDPLISWRLLGPGKEDGQTQVLSQEEPENPKSQMEKVIGELQIAEANGNIDEDEDEDIDEDEMMDAVGGFDKTKSIEAPPEGLTRRDSFAEGDGAEENINSRYKFVVPIGTASVIIIFDWWSHSFTQGVGSHYANRGKTNRKRLCEN